MSRTADTICRGELQLKQPVSGYRFTTDSLILADFASMSAPPGEFRAMDLGAGCGVIGLLLARRHPGCRIILVELQHELADLARENTRLNCLEDRVEVKETDLRSITSSKKSAPSLIVSNPPYYPVGSGRINPDPTVALARHELACTLEDLAESAGRLLQEGGCMTLIHSVDRLEEICLVLKSRGLQPALLRRVLPMPGRPAVRFLLQARLGGDQALEELDPFVIHSNQGRYSGEMRGVLRA